MDEYTALEELIAHRQKWLFSTVTIESPDVFTVLCPLKHLAVVVFSARPRRLLFV